ncbi:hypothetical protein V5799_017685 [Amblyomma americanum]|uniref:Uncharacterized protein n=1 Tax=Amblyomma americanum TaxID=6943 RepID=A0AAQ4F2I8_AMBAM
MFSGCVRVQVAPCSAPYLAGSVHQSSNRQWSKRASRVTLLSSRVLLSTPSPCRCKNIRSQIITVTNGISSHAQETENLMAAREEVTDALKATQKRKAAVCRFCGHPKADIAHLLYVP